MKKIMIKIGDFLFKYRNHVFPLYILALFLAFMPPSYFLGASTIQTIVAIVVAFAGLAMRGIVIGLAYIKRGGLNKKVYAENLVTEGMFSLCRNPLYVGNMLIYAGEFLMFGNFTCFIIGTLSFWFIYECIIATEENYLKNKFGDAYKEYCKDVPRWIPKFGRFKSATEGMKFNWKKVVVKDYSTIFSTTVVLIAVKIWDLVANSGYSQNETAIRNLGIIILLMGVASLGVRVLKKSGKLAA
jgi:protein-S-isoprenylcysteine O-methyltransferase Ste14